MANVSDREILDLKNQVAEQREKVIRAQATMQEVENNIRSCANQLREQGVDIGEAPQSEDAAEWDAFYQKVLQQATTLLENTDKQLSAIVEEVRQNVSSWPR